MTLSTITIISLLLAVYGLVAIIRDIVGGVKNAIKRRKANEQFNKEIQEAFTGIPFAIGINSVEKYAMSAIGENACKDCTGTMAFSSNSPKPKRKYNKSGKKPDKKSK
jgi:hypothetical protein